MRTEKLELDERLGNEYAGCCVFHEISWAKRSRIIQKYTKYHPITGQVVKTELRGQPCTVVGDVKIPR
jgi:hypothetical protein